jgi:hypothetical protein
MKKIMDFKWISFLREKLYSFTDAERKVFIAISSFTVTILALGALSIAGWKRLSEAEKEIQILEKKTKNFVSSIKKREQFFKELQGADKEFLQRFIAPTIFLQKEQEILSKIEDEKYVPIWKRLEYLSQEENRLQFIQGPIKRLYGYEESEWGLGHRVELSKKDLFSLLSSIEKKSSSKPEFIIKKIDLIRNEQKAHFSLDMEILQRGPHEGL